MFKDGEKVTLLHLAASCNLENIVNALIEKGANVNEKGAGGETHLHETTHLKSINIANVLIKKGADVNSVDMLGNTPLHYLNRSAIKKGQIAGGAATLLGTAIAVALFATRTVTAELIPIVIAVAAITAAALTVGNVTYKLLKPNTKVDGVAVLTNVREESASITL